MRKESELTEDINKARQAESIVNHPIFIASLKTLKELTVLKFENLGFADVQQMQECNVRLNLIEEFENNLIGVIQSGNAALTSLEQIQTFNQEMANERRSNTNK